MRCSIVHRPPRRALQLTAATESVDNIFPIGGPATPVTMITWETPTAREKKK